MPLGPLLRLVNQNRVVLQESDVPRVLHDMGIDVEQFTSTRQFTCGRCDRIIERTDAQGPPTGCPSCGTDFREASAALTEGEQSRVARLDMLSVRPDIFDPGGLARFARGFLSVQPGLIGYAVAPPRWTVTVDPALQREESFRPFVSCGVVRGVTLDHERIKFLMNLQENLHWALGRDRKLASIGVYDLDTLSGDTIRYRAVKPDELRFVPLGGLGQGADAAMTLADILQRHRTGQAYAHLLAGQRAYPILQDAAGQVLSMPPIINSEETRVTRRTKNLFVDVTGLSQRTVDRALNILLTSTQEMIPDCSLEAVRIQAGAVERITPVLEPVEMTLDLKAAEDAIGVELSLDRLQELLARMGHGVASAKAGVRVRVPAWRNDVMHAIDLIEDAAVAFGYENIRPRAITTPTLGRPRPLEERAGVARRVLTGLGFHQVITLTLGNDAALQALRLTPGNPHADALLTKAVRIANPISVEQTICRVSLMPGLLHTLSINKQYELPQHIFEIGDCSFVDPDAETGAREVRCIGVALIGSQVGYADIRAVLDAISRELEIKGEISASDHPTFLPGRGAQVAWSGRSRGILGEAHPEVLEHHGLRHPVAILEMELPRSDES